MFIYISLIASTKCQFLSSQSIFQYFKNKKTLKIVFQGVRGGFEISFLLELFYFCELGAHAKFRNLRATYSGILVSVARLDNFQKIPLTPMGSLLHGLHMLDRLLRPLSTTAEIFRNTRPRSYLQTSLPTPQKLYLKFRNTRTTCKIPPMCSQKYHNVWVGANFFHDWNSYMCLLFRSLSKILRS